VEVGGVVHAIDQHGDRKVEAAHEISGDRQALLERLGLRVADAFGLVAFHLPLVLGMRFLDVDHQKSGAVPVSAVHLGQALDRAPKGRPPTPPATSISSSLCGEQ
jgi:hypothetical protein